MRHRSWMFACGALLPLWSAPGYCDGVAVKMTNDGTDDIMLTVYDTTVQPKALVLSQRVNGFTTISLHLTQDSQGQANLAWTAVTVDPANRKCGQANQPALGDAAAVTVRATDDCAATKSGEGSIPRRELP